MMRGASLLCLAVLALAVVASADTNGLLSEQEMLVTPSPTSTPKPTTAATPKSTTKATPKPTTKRVAPNQAVATPKPTGKATTKATPKPTTKATPKPTPKPTTKATPKATTKATPKATPKVTTKATPKATTKATPKATTKATPKATPKATTKATPKATPKATTKATPKATPKATTKPTKKATPKPTKKATAKPNYTTLPVANGTVKWPLNPVTHKRYSGIKEFVIVLHDNLLHEKHELDTWFNTTYRKALHKAQAKLKHLRNLTVAQLTPYHKRIAVVQKEIARINHAADKIRKQVARRVHNLNKARQVIRTTDRNWNRTISSVLRQRQSAREAVVDVNKIYPLLSSTFPKKQVAQILLSAKKKAAKGNKKVASMLELALSDSKHVNNRNDIVKVLDALKTKLTAHINDLYQDLIMARNSRRAHIKRLKNKLLPFTIKVRELQRLLKISLASIPDLNKKIAHINKEALVVHKKIQSIDNRLQKVADRLKDVNDAYVAELKNLKERQALFSTLHQFVKKELVGSNTKLIKAMRKLTNILKPTGPVTGYWNEYYAPKWNHTFGHNASKPFGWHIPAPIDPLDTSSALCGNWKFDESNGSPYAIDSSGYGHDGWLHHIDTNRLPGHDHKSKALLFDGMQSYVDLGHVGYLGEALGAFTIDVWVRTIDTHPGLSSIVKFIDDGLGQVLAIDANRRVGRPLNGVWPTGQQSSTVLDYESKATLVYLRDAKGRVLAGHVRADYFDNKWHHLRWTVMNATKNHMAFYLDGKLQPFIATIENSPKEFHKFHRNLYVGAGNNRGRPEGFFDGAISGVRVFCGRNISVSSGYCCRTCNYATQKNCGDMCIKKDAVCHLPVGCACAGSPPATPAPTATPKSKLPKYLRGTTDLNKKSILPAHDVPKHSEPDKRTV